jgi:hypothetical protein
MSEIQNNEQIEQLTLENKQLEQMNELSDINSNTLPEETIELTSKLDQYHETLEFINDCDMSIFNFTKDKTNEVKLKPKEKTIKKKYRLYQYNLYINEFIYIGKFTTLTEINKYLENLDIHINLKRLIKNKLFKIELVI